MTEFHFDASDVPRQQRRTQPSLLLDIAERNLLLGNEVMEAVSQALAAESTQQMDDDELTAYWQEKVQGLVLLAATYASLADAARGIVRERNR